MKRLVIALMLAVVLLLVVAAPALADDGGTGYGNDPSVQPDPDTPNQVYVPEKAFDARGPLPPGNPDSHGAIFKVPSGGGV